MDEELRELEDVELDDEVADVLPERAAMSIIDVGDTLGPPPLAEPIQQLSDDEL